MTFASPSISKVKYLTALVAAKVSSSTDNWVEYTIPLNYHDETKTPTHIVISCAASMFGDYFTGYDGSQLWLDNFELIY